MYEEKYGTMVYLEIKEHKMSNFKLNETQLVCVAEFKAKKGKRISCLPTFIH